MLAEFPLALELRVMRRVTKSARMMTTSMLSEDQMSDDANKFEIKNGKYSAFALVREESQRDGF